MGKKQNPKKTTPKKKGKNDISPKVKGTPDEALKALLSASVKNSKKK